MEQYLEWIFSTNNWKEDKIINLAKNLTKLYREEKISLEKLAEIATLLDAEGFGKYHYAHLFELLVDDIDDDEMDFFIDFDLKNYFPELYNNPYLSQEDKNIVKQLYAQFLYDNLMVLEKLLENSKQSLCEILQCCSENKKQCIIRPVSVSHFFYCADIEDTEKGKEIIKYEFDCDKIAKRFADGNFINPLTKLPFSEFTRNNISDFLTKEIAMWKRFYEIIE